MTLVSFTSSSSPESWTRPKHWPDHKPVSLWREPSCIAGLSSSNLECLRITSMPDNLQISQSKAMAVHSTEKLVIGSRPFSGSNNGDLQFVNYSEGGFRAIRKFSLGSSCTSLCWIEDRLLCGTGRADALFYRLDPESIPKMLAVNASFSHEKVMTSESSKSYPYSYPVSMRLNSARINPVDIDIFCTAENSRLHLWNFGRSDTSTFSGKITASTILAAEWSPHSAHQIITGGVNQSLRLLDTRQLVKLADRAVIWKMSEAHSHPIKTVSWSPLVPYWVASGSDDGSINLWDIRLNKGPFCSLQRHTNAVQSVSWSSSHSEILVSSANDCSCRIWNLTMAPHYIMNSCHGFESPPIVTEFSAISPNRFFALATDGAVQAIEMTNAFFRSFTPHRFYEKNSSEYRVEEKIYGRDFEAAIALIAEKGSQLWKEGRYEKTSQLVSIYSETEFDNLLGQVPESYEGLVKNLSYYVCPMASRVSEISEPTSLKLRILRMRLNIHNCVKNKQHESLLRLENDIIDLITRSDDALDPSLLQSIIETIMPKEFIRALNLTLRIGECLRDRSRFSDFISISMLIMSPTVYDSVPDVDDFVVTPALAKKASVAIERDLRNPKVVIPQIELLIKVHTAITRPDGSSAIIQIMEDQQGTKIIPSILHRLYFNALMQLKHYDKFFILATQLAQHLEGYPFSNVLLQLMENVALPRISNFFSQDCIEESRTSGDTSLLVAGTLSVVNMTQNCAFLPDFLKDDLPRWILKFSSELDQNLKYLSTEEAALQANTMLDQMNQIRDAKRTNQVFCKDEMTTLYAMLKKHSSRNQAVK